VIRGNLLVIPIGQAILYVEPIYLQAEASQLPELRRVIVAYGNRIAMAETLAEGLAQVMSGDQPASMGASGEVEAGVPRRDTPESSNEVTNLILKADGHYQAAQECLLGGDWACYGAEMDALHQVLEALVEATQE
jgi:uncharacterized membrane protein (UPF0182 family)